MAGEGASVDVAIIGAGIVGCAIAQALSPYRLDVAVLDSGHDVGEGTSKANSGILHTGFDAPPGTLEARLVTEGRRLWDSLGEALHIPILATGAVLVALSDSEAAELEHLKRTAEANGVHDVEILSREGVLQRLPHVNPAVTGGLWIPRESVTDPFTAVVALAEHAALNGVRFLLGHTVVGLTAEQPPAGAGDPSPIWRIHTSQGSLTARWVVNAAGLFSDEVAAMTGRNGLLIRPRKGEFLILESAARRWVPRIVLPVPTRVSKGILVAPTAAGHVLAGPTAVDQEDKRDKSVTREGLLKVREGMVRLIPRLAEETVVSTFAGLRAVGSTGDYLIEVERQRRVATLSGIRSTGLSAAPAIARYVVQALAEAGLPLETKPNFTPTRPRPPWVPGDQRPCFDGARLEKDPSFGRLVCLCERVSEGEVAAAVRAPLPALTLDAVKRRTWATAGRCQGFFCTSMLLETISRLTGVEPHQITKHGPGSELVAGPARRRAVPRDGRAGSR